MRAWNGLNPTAGWIAHLTIFSGVAAATCSMSMPPAAEAMNTTHSFPRDRSTTRLRYSSRSRGGRLLHENRAHLLPLRARLVGHELHPEDRPGGRVGLIRRSGRLHAAALSPAAGVDLRLDDGPSRQFGREPVRLLRGSGNLAARHRNPVCTAAVSLPGIHGSSCRTSVVPVHLPHRGASMISGRFRTFAGHHRPATGEGSGGEGNRGNVCPQGSYADSDLLEECAWLPLPVQPRPIGRGRAGSSA